ncbi:hypothetical protein PCURB6_14960 [Paenibacillus curdlanolyticus]|nr:hypothetical protein PCURB6_14960 [Paenibacillus curdlanolyticus]
MEYTKGIRCVLTQVPKGGIAVITVTETAVDKIKEMLEAEETPNLFLRVGVKEGGCSGFSYGMGFDDERHEGDVELESNGLKVVVDSDSLKYLNGLEIDWKEQAMGGGFTIHNPNATVTCGCGSSFRTATAAGNPSADPC